MKLRNNLLIIAALVMAFACSTKKGSDSETAEEKVANGRLLS
jgi:hypothetical protein